MINFIHIHSLIPRKVISWLLVKMRRFREQQFNLTAITSVLWFKQILFLSVWIVLFWFVLWYEKFYFYLLQKSWYTIFLNILICIWLIYSTKISYVSFVSGRWDIRMHLLNCLEWTVVVINEKKPLFYWHEQLHR